MEIHDRLIWFDMCVSCGSARLHFEKSEREVLEEQKQLLPFLRGLSVKSLWVRCSFCESSEFYFEWAMMFLQVLYSLSSLSLFPSMVYRWFLRSVSLHRAETWFIDVFGANISVNEIKIESAKGKEDRKTTTKKDKENNCQVRSTFVGHHKRKQNRRRAANKKTIKSSERQRKEKRTKIDCRSQGTLVDRCASCSSSSHSSFSLFSVVCCVHLRFCCNRRKFTLLASFLFHSTLFFLVCLEDILS